MIGQLLGHYKVLQKVGAGGMGEVYRSRDQQLDRDVAIKVLPANLLADPASRQRLLHEARMASALNHPHICTIFEVGETSGQIFIVMEFVSGDSLKQFEGDGLPTEVVLRYATQIADALVHAHSRNVIHRDLKSANVIISEDGRAKILDFGLAMRLRGENLAEVTQSNYSLADSSPLAGTLGYIAPEILQGEAASPRTDIWAFGVLLYEMCTGQLPFRGRTGYELTSAILREDPKPLPNRVPEGLRAIVHRCLMKEPARRYQQAAEVRAALEAIQSDSAIRAFEPPAARRNWLPAIAAILIVAALVAAVWYSMHRRLNRGSSTPPSAPLKELAVLPFAGAENDPATNAFGTGLTETLAAKLAQLSRVHSLEVVPPSELKGMGVTTLSQARQEFGVNTGLELTLHRSGTEMRVTYILVDANTLHSLHGDTITAPASDPFKMEDDVADSVIAALGIKLRPDEQRALASRGTAKPAAYDFYLQGQGYLQDFHKAENLENAISVFNHALEQDPHYAPAQAGLGEAFWYEYELTTKVEWVERARTACTKAVALSNEQGDGHICLGLVFNGTGKYDEALKQYQQAVDLQPTNDIAFAGLALAYERLNRLDEAEKTYRQAISLRPSSAGGYNALGGFYSRHARYSEAADMFSQMVSLAPSSYAGYTNWGSMYVQQGQYQKALPLLERAVAIRPGAEGFSNLATAYFQLRKYPDAARTYEAAAKLDDQSYEIWGNLGDAYYWAPGMRDRAPAAYRKAIPLAGRKLKVNPKDSEVLGYLAGYYAMLGDKDNAMKYLSRAQEITPNSPDFLVNAAIVHNQLGDTEAAVNLLLKATQAGAPASSLRDVPNFDNLRGDSRLKQLFN
jgi:tetratricopeptide (TPR) repeat protein/predicted Ser/Thr protein kinase